MSFMVNFFVLFVLFVVKNVFDGLFYFGQDEFAAAVFAAFQIPAGGLQKRTVRIAEIRHFPYQQRVFGPLHELLISG